MNKKIQEHYDDELIDIERLEEVLDSKVNKFFKTSVTVQEIEFLKELINKRKALIKELREKYLDDGN